RLTLAKKGELNSSFIQLLFSDKPIQLRQWTIRDQQGIEVRVSLLDTQRGGSFSSRIFEVDPDMFSASKIEN
ncbi:MAG: outer membrane lipoprotein carrier protein LolA, partial [Rhodospirillaceae bacterium]|nr:outer membrane lipoprotein carrier protein LolA [Rhodospirillaceae bacterium]